MYFAFLNKMQNCRELCFWQHQKFHQI
jgi:hypothetical protein